MPAPSITTSYNKCINEISILNNFISSSSGLEIKHHYLISEVIMLRIFSVFESTVPEVAYKLACGATYRNGTTPLLITTCTSMNEAHSKMLSLNRRRAKPYLKWTMAQDISDNIQYVLNPSDSFNTKIQTYSSLIEEMRIVRNQIAHRTTSTARQFNQVLTRIYGANPRLTMGAFLTSSTRHSIPNINRYIQTMNIILTDITNG